MNDQTTNIRQERIEKLLNELQHEITRGMLEREIDETLTYRFVVPISRAIRDGVVFCEFKTRPLPRHMVLGIGGAELGARLTIVKNPAAG